MHGKRIALLAAATVLACANPAAAAGAPAVDMFGSFITGSPWSHDAPTPVSGLGEVVQVDPSNSTDYALTASGTVWAWGNGALGQLGDGTKTSLQEAPVKVSFPKGVKVIAIGEADSDAMAVDSEGHGWAWGDGKHGALCGVRRADAPVELSGMSDLVAVQGAGGHSLWLTSKGTVYGCGDNKDGQLGLEKGIREAGTPTQIPVSEVVQVSVGPNVSMVRTANGEVLTFGSNESGQIGNGEMPRHLGDGGHSGRVFTPYHVPLPERAIDISAGGDRPTNGSMLAITAAGTLYAWGDDRDGQLGNGSETRVVPSPVDTGLHFEAAVTGDAFSLGLTAEGDVYAWGADSEELEGGRTSEGQLGNGLGEGVRLTPTLVDSGVTQVAATAGESIDLH